MVVGGPQDDIGRISTNFFEMMELNSKIIKANLAKSIKSMDCSNNYISFEIIIIFVTK